MPRSHYNQHEEAAIERARIVLSQVPDPVKNVPESNVYDQNSENNCRVYESASKNESVITPLSLGANRLLQTAKYFPLEVLYGGLGSAITIASHEIVKNATNSNLLAKLTAGLVALSAVKSYREKKRTSTQ